MNSQRHGLSAAAGQGLVATTGRIDCGVDKLAIDFASPQEPLLQEMAQRLLNFGMQDIGKLMGVVAVGGAQGRRLPRWTMGFHSARTNRCASPKLCHI